MDYIMGDALGVSWMRGRTTVLLVLVLSCWPGHNHAQEEVCTPEMHNAGTCGTGKGAGRKATESPVNDMSMQVTFSNTRASPLKLYWVHPDTSEAHYIQTVDALSDNRFNTFVGHKFKAESADGTVRHVVMRRDQTYYPVPDQEEVRPKDSPSVIDMPTHRRLQEFSTGIPIMFYNLAGRDMITFFEDCRGCVGVRSGVMQPGEKTTTASYPGHTFCFTPREQVAAGCRNAPVRITVNESRFAYPIQLDGEGSPEIREQWEKMESFNNQYYAEKGFFWVGTWPREPPVLYMHPADRIGDEIEVRTTVPVMPAPEGMTDPSLLKLQVISLEPRAFFIPHFLSDEEAEHIVDLARPRVSKSLTGQGEGTAESKTRTSKNTFVPRKSSKIVDRIFSRAAHLLNLSDNKITANSEDLQVVHYAPGQEYTPHHDWWHSEGGCRYITLLLYLNDVPRGGATAFPKAKAQADKPWLLVPPRKGTAAMFYNILPDGNTDDRALHAALPVLDGEKWLANFWVWDPVKSFGGRRR